MDSKTPPARRHEAPECGGVHVAAHPPECAPDVGGRGLRALSLRESATAADSAASASARNAGTAASRASRAARDSEEEESAAARASSSDAEIHGIFLW